MVMNPGDRVTVNGKPGIVVEIPAHVPLGYCVVKYNHSKLGRETYLGTLTRMSEVRAITTLRAQPLASEGYYTRNRKPLTWRNPAKVIRMPMIEPIRKAA